MHENLSLEYFPSLEGIRGYAFIFVFLIHYTEVYHKPRNPILYPFFILQNTAWFLVPIFFVLSGFLITRILLNTRDRAGYFRVFYLRRAVRVFPLYYLTIIPFALFGLSRHWNFQPGHLLYFVYLQNFSHVIDFSRFLPIRLTLTHLWSLAIEEQFYLVWPVVVWFTADENALLRVSYWIIAGCTLIRIAWPLTHIRYDYAYYCTFTRVDAIIIGAVLCIYYKRPLQWQKLVHWARILIPAVWIPLVISTVIRGNGLTTDYMGVAVSIPAMNILGACFVILAIHPGFISRVCSGDLICWLGRLSYALYLFHAIYARIFKGPIRNALDHYLPHPVSYALVTLAAFIVSLGLAMLSYRLIEEPAMRWKNKWSYGPSPAKERERTEETEQHAFHAIHRASVSSSTN